MAKAEVQVTLRGSAFEGGFPRYTPGELIQGSVMVNPDKDINCRAVRARLLWYTEGTGDRDEGVLAEQVLAEGMLRANTPTHYSFSFPAGHQPWSYAGHHIHIIWAVEVVLDMAWARDPRGEARFILQPQAG